MKVSVVIPVHNGAKYLPQAIESVLAQTYRDLELIAIDDGSTDKTLSILQRYSRVDKRVRVLTHENRGVTATANRGLSQARGEWVARLDADDVFFPEKIARQLAFVKAQPAVRIAGTLGHFINHAGRVLGLVGTEGPFSRPEFENMADRGEPVFFIHSSTLMHRETVLAVGGYRDQFLQAEDVDLWLRMVERGHLLLKMREPLLFYRIHKESLTMARNAEQKRFHRWVMACAQARRAAEAEPNLEAFLRSEQRAPRLKRFRDGRKEWGERLYQRAALHYACGEHTGLFTCLLASLALNPRHVIPRLYDRKLTTMFNGCLPTTPAMLPGLPEREVCRYAAGK